MAQYLGIVDIEIDGQTIPAGDDATLDPGGVNRPVVKGAKVYGFREETQEAKLEVTVYIGTDFSVDFYRAITNSTINMKADTGQLWSMQGAWCANPPPIGQKEGSAKLTFISPPAEEILS